MEEWEAIIEGYPDPPDVRSFIRMLKTAEVILKQDLAEFEIEWITDTLFYTPVNLLTTVSSNRNEAPWSKPISDAFKLIGEVAAKFPVEHVCEDIAKLCNLPYSPHIRKDALNTLTRLCPVSPAGALGVPRHVDELEHAATGKAPLALLVGTIAEHYPEEVSDMAPRIWRVYLNLLESNKNTDTVINAVLQGLLKLLKNFGQDLPVAEFKDLYDKMTKEYLQKGKCEEVCLSILQHHADLFKELLSRDSNLRLLLWRAQAAAALTAVYSTVATVVDKHKLQNITDAEIVPRTQSGHSATKYTALRILRYLCKHHQIGASIQAHVEVQAIERDVRCGNVPFDVVDQIQWCIECGEVYSDRLLQTCILFYEHIPSSRRRAIIVYGLLNAPDDVRNATVSQLITECCQTTEESPHNIEKYIPLWKDIFDSKKGTDSTVLEKSKLVFEDLMDYLYTVLEAVLDEEHEEFPSKISPLLTLAYHILTIHPLEEYTKAPCGKFLKLLEDLQDSTEGGASLLYAATAAAKHAQMSLAFFCDSVRVERCRDEAVLCAACLMLLEASGNVGASRILQALEVLFTRKDAEPQILSKALRQFENIIQNESKVDEKKVDYIIHLVEKLRNRKDNSKEGRILQRDLIIFLGKYGNNNYITEMTNENIVISKLKDTLTLNIQNTEDGTVYRVNLQRILQLAILHEDPDALQKLLAIICVNLSTKRDPHLEMTLPPLMLALCRSLAAGGGGVGGGGVNPQTLVQAGSFCKSQLSQLIQYISEEKSPGVRKMLSDTVESILMSETSSDAAEQLAATVADRATVMLARRDAIVRSGGLSITETLLSALKDNHLLQKNVLPNLLTLILETNDFDAKATFKMASKIFIDNFEIYTTDIVYDIVETLTRNLFKYKQSGYDPIIFKWKANLTAQFLKEIKGLDIDKVLSNVNFDISCERSILFIAEMSLEFEKFLECVPFKRFLKIFTEMDYDLYYYRQNYEFEFEAILKFMVVYSDVLLEEQKELTINAVKNLIKIIMIPLNRFEKHLDKFISVYRLHLGEETIDKLFQEWFRRHVHETLTHVVRNFGRENYVILHYYAGRFKSVNVYMDILKVKSINDPLILVIPDLIFDLYNKKNEIRIRATTTESRRISLSSLLEMGLRSQKNDKTVQFLNKCLKKNGVNFVKDNMGVFSKIFVRKPFVLIEVPEYVVLLKDLLKCVLKKKCSEWDHGVVLELVDTLWPIYKTKVPFEELCSVLKLTRRLSVLPHAETNLVAWVKEACAQPGEGMRLLEMLPGGDGCGGAYRTVASTLPVRLSELRGTQHCTLQSILDALSATADAVLLDIVMKIADCDPSKGWWDEAMASCMGAVAGRAGTTFRMLRTAPQVAVETREVDVMSIAKTLFEFPSVGACNRLLIPLLRYSSSSFCEHFYSTTVNKLLSTLATWPRDTGKEHYEHRRIFNEHTRALALITLAFEKIPLPSLKSADSPLYQQVEGGQPSYLLKKASATCVNLRNKPIPDDASLELKNSYRQALIENYKCLSAALCLSRPAEKFYEFLFSPPVWAKLVDLDANYKLPLQSQWNQRRTLHTVVPDVTAASASAGTRTRTTDLRTRVFLRTLSDDPLQYDLMRGDEATVQENAQELELAVNELNSLEVAGTLTALLRHVASLDHTKWKAALTQALGGEAPRNVQWLLAQIICDCKEDLKPHASDLLPALLAVVTNTAIDGNGRKTLNSLHIDVLETVLYWQDSSYPETSLPHVKSAIEYLINTAIDNDRRQSVMSYLLSLINRVSQVYSGRELPWNGFEDCLKVPEKLKALLRILLTITKHKIHIPELLPTLAKLDFKYWSREPKLAELFGFALSCASETEHHLASFRRMLDRKRQNDPGEYVRMVYYTQMGFGGIVDEFNFRMITDLAPKLVATNKTRCLHIIATHMQNITTANEYVASMFETIDITALIQDGSVEALRVAAHGYRGMGDRLKRQVMGAVSACCCSSDVKVRKAAFEVALKAFEDLFMPKFKEPSSKRAKLTTSDILTGADSSDAHTGRVTACVARGVTDWDPPVGHMVREGVGRCLSTDMGLRLSESFLLSICIPATLSTASNQDLSVCVSAFMELLFSGLRGSDRFRELRLSELPLVISEPTAGPSKLLTNLRTYQGTFLRTTGQVKTKKKTMEGTGINVQVTIDEILQTFIEFAKNKPDVSSALCLQVIKSALSAGCDPHQLCTRVCDVISCSVTSLSPLAAAAARLLVGRQLGSCHGFENSLQKLLDATKRTEGESLIKLLYEDYQIRKNPDLFILGTVKYEDEDIEMQEEIQTTSLQDIMSAFGKLADWDKLTIQQKNKVKRSGLPTLWVDDETFKSWIDQYQVTSTKSWFDKLVVSYRDDTRHESVRWLRQTDRWPRSHFHTSVVIEALEKTSGEYDTATFAGVIGGRGEGGRPGDCLAEWAARIMIRRAYKDKSLNDSPEQYRSSLTINNPRAELEWCRAANDRCMPRMALKCLEIIKDEAEGSSRWKLEMARAMAAISTETRDEDMLREAYDHIDNIEVYCDDYEVLILANKFRLEHTGYEEGVIPTQKLEEVRDHKHLNIETYRLTAKHRRQLSSLYELAMSHCGDVWKELKRNENTVVPAQNEILKLMGSLLADCAYLDLGSRTETYLSVLLNCLDDVQECLDGDTAKFLLDKLSLLQIDALDSFSLDAIKAHSKLFPAELFRASRLARATSDDEHKHKQCLRLVRDPRHSLLQLCAELRNNCLNDAVEWKKKFELIKEIFYENPYAAEATEYRLLSKYKKDLYQIAEYEDTTSTQRKTTLEKIIKELAATVKERDTLRLSQLCPALARYRGGGGEGDRCMSRLLGLGDVAVVKFEEQVSVFTDAISRPAVLVAVCGDGSRRRLLHKSGDRLQLDAAALRVARATSFCTSANTYQVTPLGADSGLIEFVENTERLRNLIKSEVDLDEVDIGSRAADQDLILSSSSLELFKKYCSQVPAYTLRSAIERNSSSIEDFIAKRQRFTETLSAITILTSTLGLGDRHLENLLWSADGGLWCVDWSALLQYGAGAGGGGELLPARLTRNLLAVCDLQVLESNLQNMLQSIRSSQKLFLHAVRMSFKWMGDEFLDKYEYIESLVVGRATSRDVTVTSLVASNKTYKERYVKLLDDVMGEETKSSYTVVEQVECLLRQCTDPRILSVTKSGWEPWI